VTTVAAAAMVAVNWNVRTTVSGFVIFLVASIAWMADGWFESKSSLVIQNFILLLINVLAIWRWLPQAEEEAKPARKGEKATEVQQAQPAKATSATPPALRPSGARATAIGRCGPFLLWAGIWKRFHMFTTDDPELARSPGRWLELTRGVPGYISD
jgi:hypothetical protein